jgi:hypothetical protein
MDMRFSAAGTAPPYHGTNLGGAERDGVTA